MASALCFLSGVACPQNHTFERLFINFRAVLYGLAENCTQAFGPQKDFISPSIVPVQPLKSSEFSTTFFTLGLTLIGLTHELSSEPKPNRSSLFSDHADARPSARCISPSRLLPNHTSDLEINITEMSMLFPLNSAL